MTNAVWDILWQLRVPAKIKIFWVEGVAWFDPRVGCFG
jgi:hypothetical protein